MTINRPELYAATIVVSTLSFVAVTARIALRGLRKTGLGADDWTALAGLIGSLGIMGMTVTGTSKGVFGTHTALDPKTHASIIGWQDKKAVEYQWIVLVLTIPSIALIKLSVIFLYRRIFDMSRVFNIYSIVLIVLVCGWTAAFLFAELFQCGTHITAAWSSVKDIKKYCDDTNGAIVAFCISDLLMDLMILLAPIPMVWKLITNTKRKLQILAVFALGFLSTAGSAVRLHFIAKAVYGTKLGYRDLRGQTSYIVVWSVVEVNAALIACCLPTLRPLFSDKGLGSVVNSIRSALSLHSLRSNRSRTRQDQTTVPLAEPEAAVLPPFRRIESLDSR